MTSLTISGISSGLDTSSIIDKLVAVEGNSKTLLTKQQTAQKSAVSAYGNLLTSVGTLATQVSKLANTASWATTTAVSSSPTVTATATGSTAASLTFDVVNAAAAHTLISDETVSSTSAVIASGGEITLTRSGNDTTINVGTGTLAEVVAAINAAGAGLSATAVQTAPGQFRLQVASTTSGSSSDFTLADIDGFDMTTLNAGADAKVLVGGSLEVTSATNTFSNVVSGLSFTVSKAAEGVAGVTVSSSVDSTTVSDQVASIVTNANSLLASIAANSAWDSVSKTGGPLMGNSTVRSLQQSILGIVASVSAPGLSVTSGGQLSFDKAAFDTAFRANPAAVASAFGASATSTPAGSASYVNATAATAAGSYAVGVSAAPTAEKWLVIPPGTGVVGRLISLTRGSTTISYEMVDPVGLTPGESAEDAAPKINAQLARAGFGVSASYDSISGGIVFTASAAGSSSAFEVTSTVNDIGSGTVTQESAGADVEGTIDGEVATGIGNVLTLSPTSSSSAKGLSIAITSNDVTEITYAPGLAQQLDKLFTQMSDSSTGQLVTAQAQANAQVSNLQDAIDSWTTKLEDYRRNLTLKFTAMETALASLKSQSSALSSFSSASETSKTS